MCKNRNSVDTIPADLRAWIAADISSWAFSDTYCLQYGSTVSNREDARDSGLEERRCDLNESHLSDRNTKLLCERSIDFHLWNMSLFNSLVCCRSCCRLLSLRRMLPASCCHLRIPPSSRNLQRVALAARSGGAQAGAAVK